ncbi:Nuclear pore complex-interacting protein family member B13 [Plecturocebus cupreus]
MRARWLLFWLLLLEFPSHQSTLVIRFLLDYLYPGHDFLGVWWMLITTVFLGFSTVHLFLRKIIFYFCAQALEREMAKRKPAYKRHRRRKQTVPERPMSKEPAQKRLCLQNAFWRDSGPDSGPHSVPVRNSNCVPTENTEKTKVNMAAAQHHHCSGLPYSPYFMSDPSRPLMACRPPPPSGCHLGAKPFQSAKSVLGPLTTAQLQCPLGPSQPSSPADNLWGPRTPPRLCLLAPLPSSSDDSHWRPRTPPFECLQTPLECLETPLPPSPDDSDWGPGTPPLECLETQLPPLPR